MVVSFSKSTYLQRLSARIVLVYKNITELVGGLNRRGTCVGNPRSVQASKYTIILIKSNMHLVVKNGVPMSLMSIQ